MGSPEIIRSLSGNNAYKLPTDHEIQPRSVKNAENAAKKKKIVQLNIMYPEGDIEVCLKVFLILLAHYLYHFNRVNPMLKHQNGWTGQ